MTRSVIHSWHKVFAIVLPLIAGITSVAPADEPFNLRDHLTLSASDRVRGEFVSWFDPAGPKSDNNYNFFANRLRAGASLGFFRSSGDHTPNGDTHADPWYAGGGATSNDNVGYSGVRANGRHELSYVTDLALTYSFNRHMRVYGFYGRAFGQGVISSNFAGNNADYGYIETTVAF